MKHFIAPTLLGACTLFFANLSYNQQQTITALNDEMQKLQNISSQQEQQVRMLTQQLGDYAGSDSKLAALTLEIERLKKQRETNVPTQLTAKASESTQQVNLLEQQTEAQSALHAMASKLSEQQKSGKPIDFVADALNQFEHEEIDYAWAAETEQNIVQFFADKPEFSDITVVNSICKSTHCKITVRNNVYTQH
jgi:predicted RNase H-like nuclease (RuvC/YqgF family)